MNINKWYEYLHYTMRPKIKDHHLFANNSVENLYIIFPFSAKESVECADYISYFLDELGQEWLN